MIKSVIGLIPARSGSKRVPGKNVREFLGHPLLAYSIRSAIESGVFERVLVSTDSVEMADIAKYYGAEVPFLRPARFASDNSPDIEWIRHLLETLRAQSFTYDAFAILRPTSPFRSVEMIQRAWSMFTSQRNADSLRAIELCRQHPEKMWVIEGDWMRPLMHDEGQVTPRHSSSYQSLPPVYAQNASIEVAWTHVPFELGTIAGQRIIPFVTEGYEGFDINRIDDWLLAETLVEQGLAVLPSVSFPPAPGFKPTDIF